MVNRPDKSLRDGADLEGVTGWLKGADGYPPRHGNIPGDASKLDVDLFNAAPSGAGFREAARRVSSRALAWGGPTVFRTRHLQTVAS